MTKQKQHKSDPAPSRFTRIVRILVPIYVVGLVVSAPFVLALFGYGLAHASEGAFAQLLAMLAGVFVLAAAPPLLLLLSTNNPLVKALMAIGGLVMIAGVYGMFRLLSFWVLEPSWMTMQFRRVMSAVEVMNVSEQPVVLEGSTIGLKLVREINLRRAVTLDTYGTHVVEAMQYVYISSENPPPSSAPSFGEQVKSKLLTIDGQPATITLEDLTRASAATTLQAGRYRIEHTLLLWGLRSRDSQFLPAEKPCRDEEGIAREATSRAQVAGYSLEVGSVTRFELGSRRGYPTYSLRKLPIQYRYDHASWMQAIKQLPIESCAQREAQEKAAKIEAQRVEHEQWYEAGDGRLSTEDNPLFREICENNLEAVAARLNRGVPKYNLSGKIYECTISTPRLEMFALTMPALHAREQEREGYCNVLGGIHARRALPYLEKLAAQHLPILCTSEEQPKFDHQEKGCATHARPNYCLTQNFRGLDAWRGGLYPVNDKDQVDVNQDPAARKDTVQWLQFLNAQGIPICRTLPDRTNLLQDVVSRFPAEVVQYLATLGCDAHVSPPYVVEQWPWPSTDASAAVHWFLRRNGIPLTAYAYGPVDPVQARVVAASMGDLTAADINHANSIDGKSLLHYASRSLPEHPEEWRYLLKHGARLDVADNDGKSWFDKDYLQLYGRSSSEERQHQLIAMLDELSVRQLRELMAPKKATGESGLPIEEYDFAPGQLTMYLCRRGAKDCR